MCWDALLTSLSASGEEGFFPAFTSRGPRAQDRPESQVITLQGRRRHSVRVAGRGRQSRRVPDTHTPQPGAAGPLPSTPSVAARQLSWMAESRLRSGVPKLDALPPPQQLPDLLHLWPLPACGSPEPVLHPICQEICKLPPKTCLSHLHALTWTPGPCA